MAKQWYYAKGSTTHGPLAGPELKQLADSGQLLPEDLVWKNGMANWTPAQTVRGLLPPKPPRQGKIKDGTSGEPAMKTFALRLRGCWHRIWQASLVLCIRVSAWLLLKLAHIRTPDRQSNEAMANAPSRFRDVVTTMSTNDAAVIPGAIPLGRSLHAMLVIILAAQIPRAFWGGGHDKPTAKVNQDRFVRTNPDNGLSASRAKQQLLQIAEKVEGPFLEVIEDIVDAVETGDQPFSVADSRIYEFRPDSHQFARETIAAYEVWKTAKIREMD